jgi:hypothetical protein
MAMTASDKLPTTDDEQRLYARVLRIGVTCGMMALLVTFALYASGAVAPSVPLAELPNYWGLSVHEYLRATNAAFLHHPHVITGWAWVSMLGRGDYLCYLGIAFLAAVTIICYAVITPGLLRKRDFVYAGMTALECVILALAASGVLNVGH